jgi:hypothetical protein
MGRLARLWQWIFRQPHPTLPPDATLWTRLAPQMDRALERLRTKQRNAVLLCAFLNHDFASAAKVLRTSERRVEKRVGRGVKKLANRLRKRRAPVDPGALASACATEGCCTATVPEGLFLDILQSMEASRDQRPSLKLARRTLNTLAWLRWRRRFVMGVSTVGVSIAILGGIAVYIDSQSGFSRLITLYLELEVRSEAYTVPGLAAAANPWPTNEHTPTLKAANIRDASELYRTTNIWLAHLNFSREEWKAVQPKRIAPLPNFFQPDGGVLLRNPNAQRSGFSGVLGFDFNWGHADFELGGLVFTNVATRVKGNASHLLSLYGDKRAFKVDLNKYVKGQKLRGRDEFALNNLLRDSSHMGEALGYEFFREAQVPAPRTAFAYLSVSVAGKWQRKPLGLYLLVEPVDGDFAAERFGTRSAPILKPVTYHLFEYLGDSWTNYSEIYDVKTEITPAQQRRLIDFARLMSHASNEEFAARVGDFLDLEGFARFLAGQVILASYDGILFDGQNFYIYLDPKSQKFGFIPWDLDSCWGAFELGIIEERERASIWHPWVGKNLFLERVMEVEAFRKLYRESLEEYLARLFIPERLFRRMDDLARLIRPAVAAESAFRLERFERAVTDQWQDPPERGGLQWANYPVHQMKRFIQKRAHFVRQQLDGKSRGMTLQRPPRGW